MQRRWSNFMTSRNKRSLYAARTWPVVQSSVMQLPRADLVFLPRPDDDRHFLMQLSAQAQFSVSCVRCRHLQIIYFLPIVWGVMLSKKWAKHAFGRAYKNLDLTPMALINHASCHGWKCIANKWRVSTENMTWNLGIDVIPLTTSALFQAWVCGNRQGYESIESVLKLN